MRCDLVVVGDCNPDVLVLDDDVIPQFGQQEKLVDRISLLIGGSAAITAVAAARLGLRVALVAAVGDDPAGNFMLSQLAAECVDVTAVAVRASLPTGMTVALSRGEDRAILTATGAVASLTAQDIPEGLIAGARHLHVSSYFLIAESLGPGLAALLAQARAAGVTTSIDTNWDPAETWGGDQLRAVLAQADLLLPNEAEAIRITGEDTLKAAVATMTDPAGTMTASGSRLVVKRGSRGALCVESEGARRHSVRLPPVTPVDTTGAGDCFNAGLITGLLRGLDLPQAAALGCAVGAASTQALGGTGSAPDLATALSLAETAVIG
ncbi:MAG TPA: carbohydrate kinase family protein [Streptosporangiaceae bacterium]